MSRKAINCTLSICIAAALALFGVPLVSPQANAAQDKVSQTSSSGNYGTLSYNRTNGKVACLARVDFDVSRNERNGTVRVTTANTAYSRAAIGTKRPYLAFANTGTRLSTQERLGDITIDGKTDTYVIKNPVVASRTGTTLVFSGSDIGAGDFSSVYFASGSGVVGGTVGGDAMNAALEAASGELAKGSDSDVDTAVVELPELNEDSARVWAESFSGRLTMCRFEQDNLLNVRAGVGSYETASITYEYKKYKGYYPGYRPLGESQDQDSDVDKDFLTAEFLDSWIIDGDGYLWCVSADGVRYFFGSSFFAITENAYNKNAVTGLTKQGKAMAAGMASLASLFDCERCIAVNFKGVSGTLYFHFCIDSAELDLGRMVARLSCSKTTRLDLSYGMARDTKMVKNWCVNPRAPLTVQAGPISINAYASFGVSLDAFKFGVSCEWSKSEELEIDIRKGGVKTTEGKASSSKVSISGGFKADIKTFLTVELCLARKIGKWGFPAVAADIGLSLSTATDGDMLNACGSLTLKGCLFVQFPSMYDLKLFEAPKSKNHPEIHSLAKSLLGDFNGYVELLGTTIASVHVEHGIRVDNCTKKGGVIAKSAVSFTDNPDATYTGRKIEPPIDVTVNGRELTAGVDFTVSYSNNLNAGTAAATVRGKGTYTGSVMKTFAIARASIADVGMWVDDWSVPYTGGAQTPLPELWTGSYDLVNGVDYTLSYANNVNIGTATVKATGKGNFYGTKTDTFEIYASYPGYSGKMTKSTTTSMTLTYTLTSAPAAPITKLRVYYGTSVAEVRRGSRCAVANVNMRNKGASGSITLNNLTPGTCYFFDGSVGVTSGSRVYYRERDYECGSGSTQSVTFPSFNYKTTTVNKSNATVKITLTSAPAIPITKIRVSYGKKTSNVKKWKDIKTATVNLKKKGDSGTVKITGLDKGAKYYFLGGLAVKAGSQWYYHNATSLAHFTTKR